MANKGLRAVKEFLDDGFPLSELGERESVAIAFKGKRFSALAAEMQQRLWNFDFVVQELSNYSDSDIRDIFGRMNKYAVRISKQELRHAQKEGEFKDFVGQSESGRSGEGSASSRKCNSPG